MNYIEIAIEAILNYDPIKLFPWLEGKEAWLTFVSYSDV